MRKQKIIIVPKKKTAAWQLFCGLRRTVDEIFTLWPEFVFVCIGTELVAGDSLGPLVGQRLKQLNLPDVRIYGTLDEPVHALNLAWKVSLIKKRHPNSCVIAVDASFGSRFQLGRVSLQPGPIFPGLGVGKSLPPVGNISVTGIVCANGPDCHENLQKTPLSRIIPQVETIVTAATLLTQNRKGAIKYKEGLV